MVTPRSVLRWSVRAVAPVSAFVAVFYFCGGRVRVSADTAGESAPESNIVYVRVPAGESIQPNGGVSNRVRSAVSAGLRRAGLKQDAIVVMVDERGRPISPDLDAARKSRAVGRLASA